MHPYPSTTRKGRVYPPFLFLCPVEDSEIRKRTGFRTRYATSRLGVSISQCEHRSVYHVYVHIHVHRRVKARGPAQVCSLGAMHLGLEAGSSLPWSPPRRRGYLVSRPWVLSGLRLTRAGDSKHMPPYLDFLTVVAVLWWLAVTSTFFMNEFRWERDGGRKGKRESERVVRKEN